MMGQEVGRSHFCEQDESEFQRHLRKETAILMNWFRHDVFADEGQPSCGLELETWLVDRRFKPLPENRAFLDRMADPMVVAELSQYNAELNTAPEVMGPGCLFRLHERLQQSWSQMQEVMRELNGHLLMIGILPSLTDAMLTLDRLSDLDRYRALNEQVLHLRRGKPIHLAIEGRERLESIHKDIMLEAATTSFQVHFKPASTRLVAAYNAMVGLSFASVALAANAPYLFGADLWDETRIPLFEQAVRLPGFAYLDGQRQERVTFGHDYVRESLFELFLENLDAFPALLPAVSDEAPEWLQHVRLQNGTIWRWNRPVIGLSRHGKPHLRIEHRVMGAGPTVSDIVANLGFVIGLCEDLSRSSQKMEELISFSEARANFYAAAKDGLEAKVQWRGEEFSLRKLLQFELLPRSKRGLQQLGVSAEEVAYFLDGIMRQRIESGRNGACWQRAWIAKHGPDFLGMTEAYYGQQEAGRPVHTWCV